MIDEAKAGVLLAIPLQNFSFYFPIIVVRHSFGHWHAHLSRCRVDKASGFFLKFNQVWECVLISRCDVSINFCRKTLTALHQICNDRKPVDSATGHEYSIEIKIKAESNRNEARQPIYSHTTQLMQIHLSDALKVETEFAALGI